MKIMKGSILDKVTQKLLKYWKQIPREFIITARGVLRGGGNGEAAPPRFIAFL